MRTFNLKTITKDIHDLTDKDIQNILGTIKSKRPQVVSIDCSYLYNFHLDDFTEIKKLNLLTRYDKKLAIEWHRLLERWYNDQTVTEPFDKRIKPIKISRAFDRVTNEGLENLAGSVVGDGDAASHPYRTIGDGDIDEPTLGDRILVHEIDRINVFEEQEGGSLSRSGSTIYSIGNHSIDVETTTITECGMHSTDTPATDLMFDHSVFEESIDHVQFEDAVGSTTVIFFCSI